MTFVVECEITGKVLFDFDPFVNGRFFTTAKEMMEMLDHAYQETRNLDEPVSLRYVSGNQIFSHFEFNKHSKEKTMKSLHRKVDLYGIHCPDFPEIVNLTEDQKEEAKLQNVGNPALPQSSWWW